MVIYLVPLVLIWLLLITLPLGIQDGVKKVVNIILIVLIILSMLIKF